MSNTPPTVSNTSTETMSKIGHEDTIANNLLTVYHQGLSLFSMILISPFRALTILLMLQSVSRVSAKSNRQTFATELGTFEPSLSELTPAIYFNPELLNPIYRSENLEHPARHAYENGFFKQYVDRTLNTLLHTATNDGMDTESTWQELKYIGDKLLEQEATDSRGLVALAHYFWNHHQFEKFNDVLDTFTTKAASRTAKNPSHHLIYYMGMQQWLSVYSSLRRHDLEMALKIAHHSKLTFMTVKESFDEYPSYYSSRYINQKDGSIDELIDLIDRGMKITQHCLNNKTPFPFHQLSNRYLAISDRVSKHKQASAFTANHNLINNLLHESIGPERNQFSGWDDLKYLGDNLNVEMPHDNRVFDALAHYYYNKNKTEELKQLLAEKTNHLEGYSIFTKYYLSIKHCILGLEYLEGKTPALANKNFQHALSLMESIDELIKQAHHRFPSNEINTMDGPVDEIVKTIKHYIIISNGNISLEHVLDKDYPTDINQSLFAQQLIQLQQPPLLSSLINQNWENTKRLILGTLLLISLQTMYRQISSAHAHYIQLLNEKAASKQEIEKTLTHLDDFTLRFFGQQASILPSYWELTPQTTMLNDFLDFVRQIVTKVSITKEVYQFTLRATLNDLALQNKDSLQRNIHLYDMNDPEFIQLIGDCFLRALRIQYGGNAFLINNSIKIKLKPIELKTEKIHDFFNHKSIRCLIQSTDDYQQLNTLLRKATILHNDIQSMQQSYHELSSCLSNTNSSIHQQQEHMLTSNYTNGVEAWDSFQKTYQKSHMLFSKNEFDGYLKTLETLKNSKIRKELRVQLLLIEQYLPPYQQQLILLLQAKEKVSTIYHRFLEEENRAQKKEQHQKKTRPTNPLKAMIEKRKLNKALVKQKQHDDKEELRKQQEAHKESFAKLQKLRKEQSQHNAALKKAEEEQKRKHVEQKEQEIQLQRVQNLIKKDARLLAAIDACDIMCNAIEQLDTAMASTIRVHAEKITPSLVYLILLDCALYCTMKMMHGLASLSLDRRYELPSFLNHDKAMNIRHNIKHGTPTLRRNPPGTLAQLKKIMNSARPILDELRTKGNTNGKTILLSDLPLTKAVTNLRTFSLEQAQANITLELKRLEKYAEIVKKIKQKGYDLYLNTCGVLHTAMRVPLYVIGEELKTISKLDSKLYRNYKTLILSFPELYPTADSEKGEHTIFDEVKNKIGHHFASNDRQQLHIWHDARSQLFIFEEIGAHQLFEIAMKSSELITKINEELHLVDSHYKMPHPYDRNEV